MKTVYVSGAITGIDNWEDHFKKGEQTVIKLFENEDIIIHSPLRFPKPDFDPNDKVSEWNAYMKLSIERLLTCDTIYLLKGWEHSRGALLEFHIAREFNFNIIYEE